MTVKTSDNSHSLQSLLSSCHTWTQDLGGVWMILDEFGWPWIILDDLVWSSMIFDDLGWSWMILDYLSATSEDREQKVFVWLATYICTNLLFTFVEGCSAEVSTNPATVRIGSCAKIQTISIAGNFPYATNKGMAKTAGKAQEKMSRKAKHHLQIIIPKL